MLVIQNSRYVYSTVYEYQQKKRNKSRLHRVVRRNNSLLIIFASSCRKKMAGKTDRIARFSSKERWKRPPRLSSYVDRFSIDRHPLLLPPPLPRDKLFPRGRSRRRHELFQMEPANSQGRSRCLAMEEEGGGVWRGKRGRRIDKRGKREWKIVIRGRYRLYPSPLPSLPLPPLSRFPDNLLIVLLTQQQEISSFDASNFVILDASEMRLD